KRKLDYPGLTDYRSSRLLRRTHHESSLTLSSNEATGSGRIVTVRRYAIRCESAECILGCPQFLRPSRRRRRLMSAKRLFLILLVLMLAAFSMDASAAITVIVATSKNADINSIAASLDVTVLDDKPGDCKFLSLLPSILR